MKKFISILILSVLLFSCKSKEENFKEKITDSAKLFLTNASNSEIYDLKILEIDTITEKKELLFISRLLNIAVIRNEEDLKQSKDKWKEAKSNYESYANYDNTGFWSRQESESWIKFNDLDNKLSLFRRKSEEFKHYSDLNKSKKPLSIDVSFSFKSKDNIGAISENKYALPFSLEGDLLDQENVNRNIFKKYKAEYLLLHLDDM